MNEAKSSQVNRCFDQSQQKEQQIKDVLRAAVDRKRAEREINCLLEQFHGRYGLVDLLPFVARKHSPLTLKILLERIHRKWNKLSISQQLDVSKFEAEMKAKETC